MTETNEDRTTVNSNKSVFDDVEDLRGLRDEIKLQAHLFRAETRSKLEKLEPRWMELEKIGLEIARESTKATHQLKQTAKEIAKELLEQYRRLKSDLGSKK